MARSVIEIYNQMLVEKDTKPALAALNSTSYVAIYKLIFFVCAFGIWVHEKYWDAFKSETEILIENQKLGKARWYREMALAFQFGQELPEDSDQYDNTGLTDAEIEAKKIIKYCSVTEIAGTLRIKVAKKVAGLPSQLSEEQLAAFTSYMQRIKFAGVKLKIDSLPPDSLKIELDVFYDPLVLTSTGTRIDGESLTPVQDAIKEYLNELPFNGEYANTRLTNKLEAVSGVVFPVIKLAQAQYGLFPFVAIDEKYIPDAGYLTITTNDNLTINFREYVQS